MVVKLLGGPCSLNVLNIELDSVSDLEWRNREVLGGCMDLILLQSQRDLVMEIPIQFLEICRKLVGHARQN